MATYIDNVMDAIETALKELVEADGKGTLRRVERAQIDPFTGSTLPVIGLVIAGLRRDGATWIAEALITLVTSKGAVSVDERVLELIALCDAKIMSVNGGNGGAGYGGEVARPSWDLWYTARNDQSPLMHVGAVAGVEIRCGEPLLVPA